MKKLLLGLAFSVVSIAASAQSAYEKVMSEKISKIESAKKAEDFQALSNDFERIGEKEKGNWLPYYYAALSQIMKGRTLMRENKTDQLDEIADNAQKHLDIALATEKDNSEILLLQKMIYSLKMMVNPMSRYMTFGMQAQEMLKKAETLDPDNPRVTLIKAEDVYFTPAQYGGSQEKGMALFKEAAAKYNSYKLKNSLSPNWGKDEAENFLKMEKK